MKINIEIDCTPAEMREFFGLPEVSGLYDEITGEFIKRFKAGAEGYDPLTLMQPFLAQNSKIFETMQKAFWPGFGQQGNDK